MKRNVVGTGITVHQAHELVLSFEKEGLNSKLAQKIIQSPGNRLARKVVELVSSCKGFKIWKTIRIGGLPNAEAIREDIKKAGMGVSSYADDILAKIPLSAEEKEINLVLLSPADLGYKDGAEYGKVCERAREFGLECCPAEVGPYLRRQYRNQYNGGVAIIIAMEPMTASDGYLLLFHIGRYADGGLWLDSCYGDSDRFWHSNCRFIFLLP